MGVTNFDSLTLSGDLIVGGDITVTGDIALDDVTLDDATIADLTVSTSAVFPAGAIARAALAAETGIYRQLLQTLRTITGLVLDATGGAALHKIVAGAYGTGTMELRGNDANNNTVTSTSSFEFILPPEYVAGGAITLRVNGKTSGAGTITAQTLDAEAFKVAADGTAGSDICATTIRTLTQTATDFDFTITPTGLVAGDKLRFNIQSLVTISDTTTTRTHISDVQVRCAIKG